MFIGPKTASEAHEEGSELDWGWSWKSRLD